MSETQNPQEIVINQDVNVDRKDFRFRFKKNKLGDQRPGVEINGFVPSAEGIVEILTRGGKGLELLLDCMFDTVRGAISADVSEDETFNQATYDAAVLVLKHADGTETSIPKYSWEAIANQPREDRRASAITAEMWEAFAEDYIKVMPAVTGKTLEAVTNATIVYSKKFAMVKTQKDVIAKLKDQLALYMEHTKNGEQFVDIIDVLVRKADSFLSSNDLDLLVNNL